MNDSLVPLLLLAGVNLFVVLLTFGTLWFTPQMTRPSIFFGVTVDPSLRKTPFAADCIRRFRRQVLLHTLLALAITAGLVATLGPLMDDHVQGMALGVILGMILGVFWQAIGSTVALVSVHKRVLSHAARPTPVHEASLVPRSATGGNGRLLAAMILAPLLIVACCALYLWTRWDDIPPRFVSHWGVHGPDTWTDKSVVGVFWPFLLALAAYVPIMLIPLMIRGSRRIHASGPGAMQESRFARYSLVVLMLIGCFIVALIAGAAVYLPLRDSQDTPIGVIAFILIGNLVLDAVVLVPLVRMGQGGSRLPVEPSQAPTGPAVIGDRTDDRYWKWGLFYNNPNDPALWVEKRFGIGWTINMGRPGAWWTIIALTAPGLIVPLVVVLVVSLVSPETSPQTHSIQRMVQDRTVPFENDPQLIGTWKTVDLVPRIEDFDPSQRRFQGPTFLKELVVKPNGTIAGISFLWTKGLIFQDKAGPPGHYEIHGIEGQTYLFFEWISGDVTTRGMKPQYYVLRKEST